MSQIQAETLLVRLQTKLGNLIEKAWLDLGDVVVLIKRDKMLDFFQILKLDAELKFEIFLSVTAVDWVDAADERFEVVYHLLSLSHLHRLRVKMWVPEEKPEVDSVVGLWSGANFMEREVWDMYGIRFKGHPDLRRILMYDEFVGHPLRKDYPVQGKQPRIPLREPEVRNTAVDMVRPVLVQINRKREGSTQMGGAR